MQGTHMYVHMPSLGIPDLRGRKQASVFYRKDLHMPFLRKKNAVQEVNTAKPKKINRSRSERLCLGLTPDEKQLITNGAQNAGMSRTDFIISAVEDKRIVVLTGLPEVLLELSRHGNNLNQIARCLNQRGHVNRETIEKTCQVCRNAYESLVRLVDCYEVKIKRMEEK